MRWWRIRGVVPSSSTADGERAAFRVGPDFEVRSFIACLDVAAFHQQYSFFHGGDSITRPLWIALRRFAGGVDIGHAEYWGAVGELSHQQRMAYIRKFYPSRRSNSLEILFGTMQGIFCHLRPPITPRFYKSIARQPHFFDISFRAGGYLRSAGEVWSLGAIMGAGFRMTPPVAAFLADIWAGVASGCPPSVARSRPLLDEIEESGSDFAGPLRAWAEAREGALGS